jgi:phospholipid transport system substrate-binding protein
MVSNDPQTGALGRLTVRLFLLALGLLASLPAGARAQAAGEGAPAVAQDLCDALLAGMKAGAAMDFRARSDLLRPAIERDFDLGFMTRLVVGPPWRGMADADRRALVRAFSDFSVATYAHEFDRFGGERFEVDPQVSSAPQGGVVVHTTLFPSGGSPVRLDYLMRDEGGRPRIIDVFLNGTISQMAARRSEYAATLRQGGAAALAGQLRRKTEELAGQPPGSS